MGIEGDQAHLDPKTFSRSLGGLDDGLMTKMDAVIEANGQGMTVGLITAPLKIVVNLHRISTLPPGG